MNRYLYISLSVCLIGFLFGCQSKAFQMLLEPQEWENLAVKEGVTCSTPEMIDGDVKTVGYAEGRWININLPTRKTVHRIVIRGTNITDAVLYYQLPGNERWQAFLGVENHNGSVIEMRTSTVLQAIRIFVSGTKNDKRKAPQYSLKYGGITPQKALGKPFAHEIELYGFVSKDDK